MTTHPDPDDIRRASFRVVFRGFDQEEVAARLDQLAKAVEELIEDRDRLSSRLGEFADRDLKSEFETVGREVTSVLEAARTAAETLRERASADAARWRSEAMAEVEAQRKDARSDAEALRTDAWTTASQLLDQVQAEVERIRTAAERDSLAVRGEAEREAHRLTASARREAEDVVRNAKMESERLVTQARSEHDEIIATAHRQAEAAQERTRALEQRRKDLMAELEQVRSTLTSFEGELEERRQGIGLSEPVELPRRAVISDEAGTRVEDWEEGHTVRVIRPDRSDEAADDSADADVLAAEVARMREERRDEPPAPAEVPPDEESDAEVTEEPPASEPEPHATVDVEPVRPSEGEKEPEPEPEPEPDRPDEKNDVFDLFRRLRQPEPDAPPGDTASPGPESAGATGPNATGAEPPVAGIAEPTGTETDVFETRERLLLPVTNDALRAVKRALADAQNQALEQLRVTDGAWTPDVSELESSLGGNLQELTDGASEAGLEAAAEMGITVSAAPQLAPELVTTSMASDLVEALIAGMESSGPDSRDRAKAVSRVFRAWRTDEAERRVRFLALTGYHRALSYALEEEGTPWRWIPAGRLCPTCRSAADAGDAVPPAHRDCNCTIVPA